MLGLETSQNHLTTSSQSHILTSMDALSTYLDRIANKPVNDIAHISGLILLNPADHDPSVVNAARRVMTAIPPFGPVDLRPTIDSLR